MNDGSIILVTVAYAMALALVAGPPNSPWSPPALAFAAGAAMSTVALLAVVSRMPASGSVGAWVGFTAVLDAMAATMMRIRLRAPEGMGRRG